MPYNTYTGGWIQPSKKVSEKNVSLFMSQRRFGATFECLAND